MIIFIMAIVAIVGPGIAAITIMVTGIRTRDGPILLSGSVLALGPALITTMTITSRLRGVPMAAAMCAGAWIATGPTMHAPTLGWLTAAV